MLSAIITIAITSCKKNSTDGEEKPLVQTVIKLPDSIVIGTQKWTTVNYNGEGGLNYNSSTTNDPIVGKFYTLQEAKAFLLPKGWRVPTIQDYTKLCEFAGSKFKDKDGYPDNDSPTTARLMSTTGWKADGHIGKNSIGFNAVPTGYYNDGAFIGNASSSQPITIFLTTSTAIDLSGGKMVFGIYKLQNDGYNKGVFSIATDITKVRYSLRFVKDN